MCNIFFLFMKFFPSLEHKLLHWIFLKQKNRYLGKKNIGSLEIALFIRILAYRELSSDGSNKIKCCSLLFPPMIKLFPVNTYLLILYLLYKFSNLPLIFSARIGIAIRVFRRYSFISRQFNVQHVRWTGSTWSPVDRQPQPWSSPSRNLSDDRKRKYDNLGKSSNYFADFTITGQNGTFVFYGGKWWWFYSRFAFESSWYR